MNGKEREQESLRRLGRVLGSDDGAELRAQLKSCRRALTEEQARVRAMALRLFDMASELGNLPEEEHVRLRALLQRK